MASVRGTYDVVKGWLLKAAEQVPEEHYAFAPAPTVRSMGALFGHIADANFNICGAASGEKAGHDRQHREDQENEGGTARRAGRVLQVLRRGVRRDDRGAGRRGGQVLPAGSTTRLGVLAFNNAHDFEHYGNIVTYMRIKGLVPPSSAGGMR